jgi:DJ-1/PfpI family
MPAIANSNILVMATRGFEEAELLKPLAELKAKGATVHVAAPEAGEIKGWRHKDWGQSVAVDLTLDAVKVGDYDAPPRRADEPRHPAHQRRSARHHQGVRGERKSGGGRVPRTLAADRGRSGQGS